MIFCQQNDGYPILFLDDLNCQTNTYDEYSVCYWKYKEEVNLKRFDSQFQFEAGRIFNKFADSLSLPFRIFSIDMYDLNIPVNVNVDGFCRREFAEAINRNLPRKIKDQCDINVIVSGGHGGFSVASYFQDFDIIYLHVNDVGPFRTLMHELIHRYEQINTSYPHDHVNVNPGVLFSNNFWKGDINYNLMAVPSSGIYNYLFTKQQSNALFEQTTTSYDSYHTTPPYIANQIEGTTPLASITYNYEEFINTLIELQNLLDWRYSNICDIEDPAEFLAFAKKTSHLYEINKSEIQELYLKEANHIVHGSKMPAKEYAKIKIDRLESKIKQYDNISKAYYFLKENSPLAEKSVPPPPSIPPWLSNPEQPRMEAATLSNYLDDLYNKFISSEKIDMPFSDFYLAEKMLKN